MAPKLHSTYRERDTVIVRSPFAFKMPLCQWRKCSFLCDSLTFAGKLLQWPYTLSMPILWLFSLWAVQCTPCPAAGRSLGHYHQWVMACCGYCLAVSCVYHSQPSFHDLLKVTPPLWMSFALFPQWTCPHFSGLSNVNNDNNSNTAQWLSFIKPRGFIKLSAYTLHLWAGFMPGLYESTAHAPYWYGAGTREWI